MGFTLNHVATGSEAEKAGLLAGDEVIAVNGYKVSTPDQVVGVSNVGSENVYSIIRNGSEMTVRLNGARLEASVEQGESINPMSVDSVSKYGFTKSLSKFGFVVCLLIATAGVLMSVISLVGGESEGFVTGLVLVVLGFAGMMSAQLTVALVETADNSREIMILLKKRD
jgi:membrane-associated protease RseP (regulator of RpoE activity)